MVTYPQDWNSECIENLTSSIITGGTPSTANASFWGGTIPWLASTEIHQKRITKPTAYITLSGLQSSSAKIAPKNSVLIALAGQGKTRGTAAFLQQDMALNQSLAALVVNKKADAEFLFYLIEAHYNELREVSSGDGGRGGLNKKLLRKYTITIPTDVREQESIAKVLSCMDEYIANLTELIEKKKGIRDGALEDLVSGRTRLKGFDGEWDEYLFDVYFTLLSNNTLSRDKLSRYGSIGNIHYGDVLIKYHSLVTDKDEIPRIKTDIDTRSFKRLQSGDVVIADTAEDDTVGKAIQICGVTMPLVGGLHTIVCRPNYTTALGYLGYYINSKCYHNQLLPHITGIKVSSISKKAIKTTVLRLPKSIDEQKAIVEVLSSLDSEIASLEEEKDKMLQIKAGAMDDLLTGRVRLTRQGG
ncbi:MAG: restriction endonuclease subunit S [Candidatus Gastranaerophilaceae bacterium]|nr:restriction endonuclease subunit S [Christensenellales bacterium]